MKRFLHGYAVAHDTTTAELVRRVMADWVRERVDSTPEARVDSTLHVLEVLGMALQLKVAGGGLQVYPAGSATPIRTPKPKPPGIDIENEREAAYRVVVAMLKEAQKLAGDEVLAKTSKARMTAMLVASNLTRTGEAVLRGYERGYLQPLVDELVNLIEQLKEELKQAREAGQESTPTGAGA